MTAAARARMRIRVPLLASSAAAWLALFVQPHACSMHATPLQLLGASTLMFAAMMLPLIGAPLGHVVDRSFARSRRRAVALFTAAYSLPWIAAGMLLLPAAAWLAQSPARAVLAIATIAAWQCSPVKQRCLNRCHAHTELAAFGRKADRDVLLFGLRHAWWCIGSCAALMLLPMLFARGHLLLMLAVTLWLAGERLERPLEARWRWRGPGKLARIVVGQMRVLVPALR